MMVEIKSNAVLAQRHATNLSSSLVKLTSASAPIQDSTTTLLGNANIHQGIQKAREISQQLAFSVEGATKNLQSVAKEFQAIDLSGAQLFK